AKSGLIGLRTMDRQLRPMGRRSRGGPKWTQKAPWAYTPDNERGGPKMEDDG
ncbi:hypothetical protein O181_095682, partial [Austropuccinia psidii MF-1]|nr:hypothetical protein [Austropuccinia psidii MF-1]